MVARVKLMVALAEPEVLVGPEATVALALPVEPVAEMEVVAEENL